MTWAMLVPKKGIEFPWIAKRAAKFVDQLEHSDGRRRYTGCMDERDNTLILEFGEKVLHMHAKPERG